MSLKDLKSFQSPDTELSLLSSNLKEWAKQFKDIPFLNGRLVEDVAINTGGKQISHNLGREPKGWFIVTKDDNGDVFEVERNKTHLTLDTTSNLTASIWIF
jgi:hypothetical protein